MLILILKNDLNIQPCQCIFRSSLNKQIQNLEKYLSNQSQNEENMQSHFSSSKTTNQCFQPQTPTNTFPIDIGRFNTQVNIHSDQGNNRSLNSTTFSSHNGSGISPCLMEREVFTPKSISINYIEGSGDAKYKSKDFWWTKKLEVLSSTSSTLLYFIWLYVFCIKY